MKAKGETPAARLLAWYGQHARKLPWRSPPGERADPYAVWLSEIMLQQTTVAAVKPYFEKFLALWPRVEGLANAPVDDVMRAWAGLGYYSRARNLHAAAKAVVADHDGAFPDDEDSLRKLPGIGPYTAAAIAAIAFGKRAVVVDGNVERVVSRYFAIEDPLPGSKPLIRARMDDLTPQQRAGDFAQAMMDLGATICTPKSPTCALCPLTADCAARRLGVQQDLPRKAAKAERPKRAGAVLHLRRADGHVLIRTRPPKGLLGGMAEFPGTPWEAGAPDIAAHLPMQVETRRAPGDVRHVFTHFELTLAVHLADAPHRAKAPDGHRWAPEESLDDEALPNVMRKALDLARRARSTS